jgi:hypothetical protein
MVEEVGCQYRWSVCFGRVLTALYGKQDDPGVCHGQFPIVGESYVDHFELSLVRLFGVKGALTNIVLPDMGQVIFMESTRLHNNQPRCPPCLRRRTSSMIRCRSTCCVRRGSLGTKVSRLTCAERDGAPAPSLKMRLHLAARWSPRATKFRSIER